MDCINMIFNIIAIITVDRRHNTSFVIISKLARPRTLCVPTTERSQKEEEQHTAQFFVVFPTDTEALKVHYCLVSYV